MVNLYNYDRRLERQFEKLEEDAINPEDRELLKEFINDALYEWGSKKITTARAYKLLSTLRQIAMMMYDWAVRSNT